MIAWGWLILAFLVGLAAGARLVGQLYAGKIKQIAATTEKQRRQLEEAKTNLEKRRRKK